MNCLRTELFLTQRLQPNNCRHLTLQSGWIMHGLRSHWNSARLRWHYTTRSFHVLMALTPLLYYWIKTWFRHCSARHFTSCATKNYYSLKILCKAERDSSVLDYKEKWIVYNNFAATRIFRSAKQNSHANQVAKFGHYKCEIKKNISRTILTFSLEFDVHL